jgi:DNA invertase Pin-like site-specific DNA recombinase
VSIKAGLKRAVAQGVKLGRPKIDSATERKVRKQLAKGLGILKVAKSLGIGTGTVQRISKERAMSPRAMTSGPQLTNSLLRRA